MNWVEAFIVGLLSGMAFGFVFGIIYAAVSIERAKGQRAATLERAIGRWHHTRNWLTRRGV